METITFKEAVKLIKESTLVRYEDEYDVDMETKEYFIEDEKPIPEHIKGDFIAMLGQDDYEILACFIPEDTYELWDGGLMRIDSDEEGVNWLYLFKSL